jgi:cardiolipin synthase
VKAVLIAYFATWLFIPHILLAGKRPVATLAWIWAVLLFPFLGPLAYLLLGLDRVTRDRLRRRGSRRPGSDAGLEEKIGARDVQLFRALARLSGKPTAMATRFRLLSDAAAFFPALAERIERARHHVHVQFFVWQQDEYGRRFRDLLVAAAKRGVQVRVLVDRLGSLQTTRRFFQPVVEVGGRFAWFRSLNPLRRHFSLHLRNHRKIQVIDGETAFIGGMNLGCEYACEDPEIGHWRDLQVELCGSVVASLQHVFAEDWYFAADEEIQDPAYYAAELETGGSVAQVLLGGPDLPFEPMGESLIAAVNHAMQRAWIASGYFVPDARLVTALRLAAARGVDVRLLNTRKSDHPWFAEIGRSYYEQLLRGGVRIFEYTGGLHHAKAMLLDERLLMVGSANWDNRSMRLNFEANVLSHCPEAAMVLDALFRRDFAVSVEVVLAEFLQRPLRQRLIEAAVRPLAPLI